MSFPHDFNLGDLVIIEDDKTYIKKEFLKYGINFEDDMDLELGVIGRIVTDPQSLFSASVLSFPRLKHDISQDIKVLSNCHCYLWPISCLKKMDMPEGSVNKFYLMDQYQYFAPLLPELCQHVRNMPTDKIKTIRLSTLKCKHTGCNNFLFPIGNDVYSYPEKFLIPMLNKNKKEEKINIDNLLADIWDARGTEKITHLLNIYKEITGKDRPGFLK